MAWSGTKVNGRRVAIIDGLRTPFLKSVTAYKDMSALDLAKAVVAELVQRTGLDAEEIDQVVYGQVVPSTEAPNIAREIVLGTGLPHRIEAYSVSRACATSTQATANAAQAILVGDADVVIAGGADSLSRPPITYSDAFVDALMKANSARDPMSKAKAFFELKPKDLLPKPPALREMSTGLTMGESAEKMAKENGITREAQDAFAWRSHKKATEAWEKGIYAQEVMHLAVPPKYKDVVDKDGLVRPDTTVEKLASLKPVFDRKYGTVTAGNSSPLTDGASALILMDEKKAKSLGYTPLAYVRSWAFAALDPAWQLLMGPSFATPKALDRAGLKMKDVDLVDMHEAFASQMLSNLQAFESKAWAKKWLNRDEAIGEVPDEKLNIYGGSISVGHPFAATGARQILSMARELDRRGGGTALVTQCAAGGLGAAMVLER
jgi:acetyl-CoA acyltransferase